jgi:cytochrome c oxidase subunit 4
MSEHTQNPAAEAATYLKTLIGLLILTGITVGASYIHFGSGAANVVVALTIATIKATLVALFFMHLLHDKKVNALIAAAGFIFLGLFLMFTLLDFDSRQDYQPRNLPTIIAPPPAAGAPGAATPAGTPPAATAPAAAEKH